jgi:hypothetical protein
MPILIIYYPMSKGKLRSISSEPAKFWIIEYLLVP